MPQTFSFPHTDMTSQKCISVLITKKETSESVASPRSKPTDISYELMYRKEIRFFTKGSGPQNRRVRVVPRDITSLLLAVTVRNFVFFFFLNYFEQN